MFDDLRFLSLLGFAGDFGIRRRHSAAALAYGPGPVAFILSGEMAVAYFLVHAQKSFYPILNQGELAALYCFVLLYLAVCGWRRLEL